MSRNDAKVPETTELQEQTRCRRLFPVDSVTFRPTRRRREAPYNLAFIVEGRTTRRLSRHRDRRRAGQRAMLFDAAGSSNVPFGSNRHQNPAIAAVAASVWPAGEV